MSIDLRARIVTALQAFNTGNLSASCIELLEALGYRSGRRLALSPNTSANFERTFSGARTLNREQARVDEWTEANFLLQLTDDEVAQTEQLHLLREHNGWNNGIYRSFAFIAIGLTDERSSRTVLATITRAVNRLFMMPTPIFFRYGDKLTLAIILRRPGKRDTSRDVLEKVTLIKDIDLRHPHAAHIRILEDLALANLRQGQSVGTFDELQSAWSKTLDISELNKRFYQELANWYYWAVDTVTFPQGDSRDDKETRNAVAVIRMITRLIFVWFIKEKGLVPDELFERDKMATTLHDLSDDSDSYYKAILQNLFFATLNTEMNTAQKSQSRIFHSEEEFQGRNRHFGVPNVYRYARMFAINQPSALALFAAIPFLNGGLFECLDRPEQGVRIDGFSDRAENPLHVPNVLFFGNARPLDLNEVFGTRNKQYQVRGLFDIFHRYKFTIEENTPIDEEVALDPELLGKVFENLLAAYNPETRTTARKQTGSFYTPREIVDYMVDEALIAYLAAALRKQVTVTVQSDSHLEVRLRNLFAYTDEAHQFTPAEVTALITAIDNAKILDLACGSGAFPMGVLHKLVFILRKLDPNNAGWKQQQLGRAQRDRDLAEQMEDEQNRDNAVKETGARIRDIEHSFDEQDHELDYTRKLYLIENCIYGVDIQPIAVQIAKLRFFISLVADQHVDDSRPNRNVRALPNLETKFVAANALIALPRRGQMMLRNPEIDRLEEELRRVRQRHFTARTAATKKKYREADAQLRQRIGELLRQDGWPADTTQALAHWDPYNQNAHAEFFDPEWMFGMTDGFDILIENPPYGAQIPEGQKEYLKQRHEDIVARIRNSFLYFMGESYHLAKDGGVICMILPNEFLFQIYMTKARRFFLENSRFLFAVNLGESVFDAIVPTCIVAFVKERKYPHNIPVSDLRHSTMAELPLLLTTEQFTISSSETILSAPNAIFSFDLGISALVNRLAAEFQSFEDYCDDVANGISTSCDDVYIVSADLIDRSNFEIEYLKECIRGGQFNRFYCPSQTRDYILYITNDFQPAAGKNIYQYLHGHKPLLIRKSVEKKAGKREWHVLFRSRYEGLFTKPKMLLRQTGDRIIACVDDEVGYFCIDSVNVAQVKSEYRESLYFLAGLLNSRLVNFFYQQISQEAGRVLAQVKPQRIRALPIAYGSEQERQAIETVVRRISSVKSQNPTADVTAQEAEIDRLVYGLYGLTTEEIKIVEGG